MIQAGRFGQSIPIASSRVSRDGDSVTIEGQITPREGWPDDPADRAAWALIARDQLASMVASTDEPVVRFLSDEDPQADGFYWLVSGGSDDPDDYDIAHHPFGLKLERVRNFAQPMVDVATQAIYRSGFGVAEASCESLYASPSAALFARRDSTYSPATTITRTADSGALSVFLGTGAGQVTSWRYQLLPADWYDGACQLEVTFDGTTWIVWPGFQIPAGVTSWRLGNGLVRVTPSATAGRIDVQHFDGSAWLTAKTYRLTTAGSGNPLTSLGTVTVLRNAPHIAAVKINGSTGSSAHEATLTVRRGDRWLYGRLGTSSSGGGVRRDSTEAATGTSLTGGIAASTGTNRYVLASVLATTEDLTNGGLSSGSGTAVDFGIGMSLNAASPASGEAGQDLLDQYGRWVSERPRVATL